MNGTWMVDVKDSFDQKAKKDSQGVDLPPSVKMIVEGVFTCVICLIVDWLISLIPFGIHLRWNSCPMVQFDGSQVWHSFCFRGNRGRDEGLIR